MKKSYYKNLFTWLIGVMVLFIMVGNVVIPVANAEDPINAASPQIINPAAATAGSFTYEPTYLPNIVAGAEGPGALIFNIYKYLIGLVGIVAVGTIIYAGVLRTMSISGAKIQQSNAMIKNALWGIVLLFGAQVIFNTINKNIIDVSRIDEAFKAIPKIEKEKQDSWWEKLGDLVPADEVPTSAANAGSIEAATNLYGGLPGTAALAAKIQPCKDCVLVPSFGAAFLTSSNACFGAATGDKGRGGCYENKTVVDKLTSLKTLTDASGLKWQVTGSYPPGADHSSKCHWDGTCLDIQLIGCPSPCNAATVNKMLSAAKAAGFSPYNEYTVGDSPKSPGTKTGDNIHLNLTGISTK